jgi:hypothetical protein
MSAEVSYLRRWLVNFPVLDNRARAPEDHTSFGVVAPDRFAAAQRRRLHG